MGGAYEALVSGCAACHTNGWGRAPRSNLRIITTLLQGDDMNVRGHERTALSEDR